MDNKRQLHKDCQVKTEQKMIYDSQALASPIWANPKTGTNLFTVELADAYQVSSKQHMIHSYYMGLSASRLVHLVQIISSSKPGP